MDLRRITDWTTLTGAIIEIRQQGRTLACGTVDAVTFDGAVLWLQVPGVGRKLYEKAGFHEAWAAEARVGFHYRVSAGGSAA
ncbi:hypothetical protein BIU82_00110 [Arthrobacter sp. SW1]|uniref:hypothetical protein n=1 Tax=Arthrobacter sp. SW1 TaxID=1920889 RepID=UPI000877BD48|nr:hypothetical protein [Arthrobacter sp. SW1]OFI39523.1 hypothetical protein BIU82_00110 [Arthrobacter sp. SW1]